MTLPQITAFVCLVLSVGFVYWLGYRGGFIEGRSEGEEDGKNLEHAENARTIRELQANLSFIRGDHRQLARQCKTLSERQTITANDQCTLIAAAAQMKLAADTFRAFPTAHRQVQVTLSYREQLLVLAKRMNSELPGEAA